MPKLHSMEACSLELMIIQTPAKLVWSSKRDMSAHYNKSNISSTTSPTEINMKEILYLKVTMREMLQVTTLLNFLKSMVVSMKAGTILSLKKDLTLTSDSTDSEVWVAKLDHACSMKLP
jgi:hypothetical protein